MVTDVTKKYCMRLFLITGDKVNPTYEISIGDNFNNMPRKDDAIFLVDASIRQEDGWFVVEGEGLKQKWVWESERFTEEEIFEQFRNPLWYFYPVDTIGGIIGRPLYSTEGYVYLKETIPQKFTFKYAVFREFLKL